MSELKEYNFLTIDVKGALSRGINEEDMTTQFNGLAQEGWSLVQGHRLTSNGWTDKLVFIFERRKQ